MDPLKVIQHYVNNTKLNVEINKNENNPTNIDTTMTNVKTNEDINMNINENFDMNTVEAERTLSRVLKKQVNLCVYMYIMMIMFS
jgi:septum formation topological specificity factor MinE